VDGVPKIIVNDPQIPTRRARELLVPSLHPHPRAIDERSLADATPSRANGRARDAMARANLGQ
jgi:hypothetical protein